MINSKLYRILKKDDKIIIFEKSPSNEEKIINDLVLFTKQVNKTLSIMLIENGNYFIAQSNFSNKKVLDIEYNNKLIAIIDKSKSFIKDDITEDFINNLINEVAKNQKHNFVTNFNATIKNQIIYNIVPCKDFCKVFEYGEDITSKNYKKIMY
jgi:hypothetical protein